MIKALENPAKKEEFVKNNFGLVHSCAHRFKGRGIEYDDLFSAGCVGLVKAIEAFDEERGVQFSTYAVPVILGEMRRLFRDGGTVKVSRSLKELSIKTARAREKFSVKHGREPTITELSNIMEVSEEQIVEAIGAYQPTISLTYEDDEKSAQFDIKVDSEEDKILDMISLKEVIELLEPKDRSLIVLRYFKNKTQVEVGKILDMTQVQISRREKKILKILKQKLE